MYQVVHPEPDEPLTGHDAEIWSGLRAMRSAPPGFARSDEDRQRRFRAALEQAQHFSEASRAAPTDTKPVMLFYCCGQVLKAWAAAALRDLWRPNSHGLKVGGIPVRRGALSEVTIELQRHRKPEQQTGDFNTLRRLMGEDPVAATEVVSVGDVWGFLSSRFAFPLMGSQPAFTYLSLFAYRYTDRTLPAGRDVETAYQVGASHALVPTAPEGFRQRIEDALPVSFAELGPFKAWPLAESLTHYGVSVAPAVLDLDLTDPPPWLAERMVNGTVNVPAKLHNRLTFRHLELVWLTLAALADVARYEPEFWRACLDVDATPDSESLVAFMNYAQVYVPGMVLRYLQLVDV